MVVCQEGGGNPKPALRGAKSEYRSTKSETIIECSKGKEIRNGNEQALRPGHCLFGNSSLFRISRFGFRKLRTRHRVSCRATRLSGSFALPAERWFQRSHSATLGQAGRRLQVDSAQRELRPPGRRASLNHVPLGTFGAGIGLPHPAAAEVGVAVVAQLCSRGQFAQDFCIAPAEHDVVGDEGEL